MQKEFLSEIFQNFYGRTTNIVIPDRCLRKEEYIMRETVMILLGTLTQNNNQLKL